MCSHARESNTRLLHSGNVVRYSLSGAPIVLRYLPVRWEDVRTRRFPILLPLLGALVYGACVTVGAALSDGGSWVRTAPEFIRQWCAWSILCFFVAELVNGGLLVYCRVLVAALQRLRKPVTVPFVHLRRTVYFSSVWQSIMLACWGVLWGSFFSRGKFPGVLAYPAGVLMPLTVVLRLLSVFYGLRRAGTGRAVAAAGTLGAVDAWYVGFFLAQALLR